MVPGPPTPNPARRHNTHQCDQVVWEPELAHLLHLQRKAGAACCRQHAHHLRASMVGAT